MIKNVNVNELQSNISAILKDVQDGDVYEVMRYSDPFAVVLSYDKYLILKGECHKCIQELKGIAQVIRKGNPSTKLRAGKK